MSTLSDALRREQRERLARLSPGERVELAFKLGDSDLELLQARRGLDRRDAQSHLERGKQRGRRASRCLRAIIG